MTRRSFAKSLLALLPLGLLKRKDPTIRGRHYDYIISDDLHSYYTSRYRTDQDTWWIIPPRA